MLDRVEWAHTKLELARKRKSFEKSYRRVDTSKGKYLLPFRILEDQGGAWEFNMEAHGGGIVLRGFADASHAVKIDLSCGLLTVKISMSSQDELGQGPACRDSALVYACSGSSSALIHACSGPDIHNGYQRSNTGKCVRRAQPFE